VTLGRAEEREGAGAFRDLDDMLSDLDCKGDVKVASVDLMRSQLGPGGSKYTLLSSARLGD
jgi:2'-5' RNA ligase